MFRFLTLEEVLELHAEGLVRHGGLPGVRDAGLVDSAVAAAVNVCHYGNGDVFDAAAAYAFHLAQAQAFIDGNKRVGVSAAVVFLALNIPMREWAVADEDEFYEIMIGLAEHRITKGGAADIVRRLFG